MTRLFVAAWPGTDAHDALAGLPRPDDEPGVRWVRPANWHVTLRFIGDADTGEVVERCANAVFPHAVARLGPVVERLDRRQIIVPVDGVDDLAAAVRRVTNGLGEPTRRPFLGHLTIARTKPGATSSAIGTPIETQFAIDEIALVASDLTPNGAVYTTVATFPTRDVITVRAPRTR